MTATAILTPVRFCQKCQADTERGANGVCKPCTKIYNAARRAANPDESKAAAAAWRRANTEKIKSYGVAWRAANQGKAQEYDKAKREANPERGITKSAAWRAANPDQKKAYDLAWRKANPEKTKAGVKAWREANPEAGRVYDHNRRARKRQNGGRLSSGLADKLFILQKGKCPCCGLPLGEDYHMDHITPLSRGGQNSDDNIQLLRRICNGQKYTKHPVDFMQSRGFLL